MCPLLHLGFVRCLHFQSLTPLELLLAGFCLCLLSLGSLQALLGATDLTTDSAFQSVPGLHRLLFCGFGGIALSLQLQSCLLDAWEHFYLGSLRHELSSSAHCPACLTSGFPALPSHPRCSPVTCLLT